MTEGIPPPDNNGNDIKTALERAEQELRAREIKIIEKHLKNNGGESGSKPESSTELENVFRSVPTKVAENYAGKKTSKDKEAYLKNLMKAQQAQAERENSAMTARRNEEEERKVALKNMRKGGKKSNRSAKAQKSAKSSHGLPMQLLHAVEKSETDKRAEITRLNFSLPTDASMSQPEPLDERQQQVAEDLEKHRRAVAIANASDAEVVSSKLDEPVLPLADQSASAAEPVPNKNGTEMPSLLRSEPDANKESQAAEEQAERAWLDRMRNGDNPASDEERKWMDEAGTFGIDTRGNAEAPITADPNDAPIGILNKDATAGESRSKLRELVGKLVGGTKEKFDWYKSSEEGLIRRNKELDDQLEDIVGKLKIERGFRWMGEKYNKLPFKYKLALGASLGLGAAFTAGTGAIAIPLALIAGQRIAGLSAMYLKFEKNSHQEKWGKEMAMLKAGVYTVLLGLTMKEAIEYASDTGAAHWAQEKVQGFLGWMMGHTASPPVASAPKAPANAGAPQATPAPEAPVVAQPSAPAEPVAPAVPETGPKPPEPVPQPVAAADAGEQVSRPIAQHFPRPEAPTRFEMPKHADFSIHEDDTTISPYDVTPTNQTQAEEMPLVEEAGEQAAPAEPPVEQPAPPAEAPQEVPKPPEASASPADASATASEAGATTPEAGAKFVVNKLGLSVDVAHADSYIAKNGEVVIFGGFLSDDALEKKAADIVSKDHSAVVYYTTARLGDWKNVWQPITQVNKVSWFEGAGQMEHLDEEALPSGQQTPITVRGPMIVNDLTDPTLKGNAPGIDDLKEVYKPKK